MVLSDLNDSIRSQWSRNSLAWAAQIRADQDVYRNVFLEPAFMHFLGDISGAQVLDLGCGEGASSRAMARAGACVLGIDFTPEMVDHAQKRELEEPLGISFQQASAEKLPFESESFDLIASWMALSDMACYGEAIKESARLLKVGGRLAFCVRHPSFFNRRTTIVRQAAEAPPFLLIGNYFEKKAWLERMSFSGGQADPGSEKTFEILRLPFTLSECINGVVCAGLRLESVLEPVPDESMCARHPRLAFWAQHAALYLFVSAVRVR